MVPSLATRATLAAWSRDDSDSGNHVDSSISGNASHPQANGQGGDISTLILLRLLMPINSLLTKTIMAGIALNVTRTYISQRTRDEPPASVNVEPTVSRVEHMQIDTASASRERAFSDLHSTSSNIHMAASTAGTSGSGTRPFYNNGGENTLAQQTSSMASFVEDTTCPVYGSGSDGVGDAEISDMVVDMEIPSVLSRNTQRPFTYLAELSQKWAVVKDTMHFVRGKIKVSTPLIKTLSV